MLIKPIILVSSCYRDQKNGNNQAIRDTWGKDSAIPYKIFIGDMPPTADDEVCLDYCPDGYFSLPVKTAQSLRWAMLRGYNYFFRAFTDTYIDTRRLLKSGFEGQSYRGNPCGFYRDLFMHGGPGYWLDLWAAQIVACASDQAFEQKFEDYWVGHLMMNHGVAPSYDFRLSMGNSYDRRENMVLPSNDIITEHLSDSGNRYDCSTMYARHALRFPTL